MENTEEEILASGDRNCSMDGIFDQIVGFIEDIIIDENFEKLQKDFMNKYYEEFDESEENKLQYTSIFHNYQELIESHLDNELTKRMPDFSMSNFLKQLTARRNELDGEVFEMLLSFSDFLIFKELMLDYKREKEGRVVDLSDGLLVTSFPDLKITESKQT